MSIAPGDSITQLVKLIMSAQQEDVSAAISFVKIVEQNPCLWNYSLKNYSRTDITSIAWKKIAEQLKDTGKKKLHTFLIILFFYTFFTFEFLKNDF